MAKRKKNEVRFASGHLEYNTASHIQNVSISLPYTITDYQYMQDAWANTLAGTVLDKKIDFVIGGGFKPVLELINKSGLDDKQIEQQTSQYKDIIDELIKIDNDLRIKQNTRDGLTLEKVFGRCVLAFEFDSENELSIPKSIKIIHAKDLGTVQINQETWECEGVNIYRSNKTIKKDEMIYLVNKENNPIYQNMYYGYSELQRVIGSSRALQRLIEYDMPEIAQSMWAGYKMIIVNTEGRGNPTTVLNTVLGGLKPGAFNAISGKKEDIEVISMDLEPKINELSQLVDLYERMIIGNFGVPGPLLGREEESNMATLFGKIRLFLNGPVAADREELGETLSKQWYERNLRALRGDEAEKILQVVRIKVEFEPIILDSWEDNVDAVAKLKNTIQEIPLNVLLDLLKLNQYKDDIEANKTNIDEQKRTEMELKMREVNSFQQLAEKTTNKLQNTTSHDLTRVAEEDKGYWFTTDTGLHVRVEPGQTKEQALEQRFNNKSKSKFTKPIEVSKTMEEKAQIEYKEKTKKIMDDVPDNLKENVDKIVIGRPDQKIKDSLTFGTFDPKTKTLTIIPVNDDNLYEQIITHELGHAKWGGYTEEQKQEWINSKAIRDPISQYTLGMYGDDKIFKLPENPQTELSRMNKELVLTRYAEEQHSEFIRALHAPHDASTKEGQFFVNKIFEEKLPKINKEYKRIFGD